MHAYVIQSDFLLRQLKYKVHLCVNKWTRLGWTTDETNLCHDSGSTDVPSCRVFHVDLMLTFRVRPVNKGILPPYSERQSLMHERCSFLSSSLLLSLWCSSSNSNSVHEVRMKTILTNSASHVNMRADSKPREIWLLIRFWCYRHDGDRKSWTQLQHTADPPEEKVAQKHKISKNRTGITITYYFFTVFQSKP